MKGEQYGNWVIHYDPPPIPTRSCDWHFYHQDFDGAPDAGDSRYGHGPTAEDCKAQIDDIEADATALTRAEQVAQAARCGCRGSDDLCPCQNAADRITRAERRAAIAAALPEEKTP